MLGGRLRDITYQPSIFDACSEKPPIKLYVNLNAKGRARDMNRTYHFLNVGYITNFWIDSRATSHR